MGCCEFVVPSDQYASLIESYDSHIDSRSKAGILHMQGLKDKVTNQEEPTGADTIDAIEHHAGLLGSAICAAYTTLNSVVTRHETFIRKRWTKYSPAHRRGILLAAWPDMAQEYDPGDLFNPLVYSECWKDLGGILMLMMEVNLENLTKTMPLQIFLNSRGRLPPWNFAMTEESYTALGRLDHCKDSEACLKYSVRFSEEPDSQMFDKLDRNVDPEDCVCAKDNYFELCHRSSIPILLIQTQVLKFLVLRSQNILHDIPEKDLCGAPVQDEPKTLGTLESGLAEHTSFSDIFLSAPYRGCHVVNLRKLRAYIGATLDTQKEHCRALREDPKNFSDTLLEFQDHTSSHQLRTGNSARQTYVLRAMVTDIHALMGMWTELDGRFARFDKIQREDDSMHDQFHAVQDIKHTASFIIIFLTQFLTKSAYALFTVRKLLCGNYNRRSGEISYVPQVKLSEAQTRLLDLLDGLQRHENSFSMPVFLTWTLESIDRNLHRNPESRGMMSGTLLSLLTELSILAEVLRQIDLWEKSPEVRKYTSSHNGCK